MIGRAYFADALYNALYLGLSEASFWRASPRKLSALTAAHNRFHARTEDKPKPRNATLADLGITG